MKTIPKSETAPRPAAAVRPWRSLLCLALAAPLLANDAAMPKDHALFAGATVKVEEGSGYFEIVGAKGNSVSLLADGRLLHLRRDQMRNVRIATTLKLTDVIARIDQMIVTPTFVGPKEDRFADLHTRVLLSEMASDATNDEAASYNQLAAAEAQQAVNQAEGGPIPTTPPPTVLAASIGASAASNNAATLQSTTDSFGLGPAHTGENALAIACELSTPRVMPNTYAIVLTEYRAAGGGNSSYNVDVEPVGELGPKPRKVTFQQAGFPLNFTVDHVSVHLYAGGLELATNLSEGRVDLTADDAMRYLVLAYVASHAKDSLPAAPLRIALPANFRQQAPSADINRTFYVTVDQDGRVQALSAEPDRQVAVNPYIDSAVRNFRYEPAIKEGKPVASVVELRLASFLR